MRWPRSAATAAYAAAALFAVGLARFALPGTGLGDGTTAGLVLALAPHLVLLVGVWPWLAVSRWASAAGLTWLVLDISSDVLARAGTSPAIFLGTRYVGHLFAAAWFVAIARRTTGATAVVGVVLAVLLGGYTLISPWVPPVALAPSGPLLVLWWVLVGRALGAPVTVLHRRP